MEPLLYTRSAFATAASVHILFPCLTLGLAFFQVGLEFITCKSRRADMVETAKYWNNFFTIAYIFGVLSGFFLAFLFQYLFSPLHSQIAPILQNLSLVERYAFIVTVICIALKYFAFHRGLYAALPPLSLIIAAGLTLTAACILAVNSWMQAPIAYTVVDGLYVPETFFFFLQVPTYGYSLAHMFLASVILSCGCVACVYTWRFIKRDWNTLYQSLIKYALLLTLVATTLQMVVGHLYGTRLARTQPMKIAAIEAIWKNQRRASLSVMGIPDMERETVHAELSIPALASLLLTHSSDGLVPGLENIPKEQWPNVPLVYWCFRTMVACGLLILLIAIFGLVLHQHKRAAAAQLAAWAIIILPVLAYIATVAGWVVAEAGRQPWTLYKKLLTSQAGTTFTAEQARFAFIGTLFVCGLTLGFFSLSLRSFLKNKLKSSSNPQAKNRSNI